MTTTIDSLDAFFLSLVAFRKLIQIDAVLQQMCGDDRIYASYVRAGSALVELLEPYETAMTAQNLRTAIAELEYLRDPDVKILKGFLRKY